MHAPPQSQPKPRAWLLEELRLDSFWIQYLNSDAIEELQFTLAHAKDYEKSWLQVTSNNYPMTSTAKNFIDRAFIVT